MLMQVKIRRSGEGVDSVTDSGGGHAARADHGLRPEPDQERGCGYRQPEG
jgi:hypothetical protein